MQHQSHCETLNERMAKKHLSITNLNLLNNLTEALNKKQVTNTIKFLPKTKIINK